MKPNLWKLYRQMLKSRIFEEKVMELWEKGSIFGEMHTGIGEEAIIAGTIDHLREGDAMALDHRGTPPLIMRGVDMATLLHEFLGNREGLCCGYGGHMHLFSREYMAASSGIVGASGPRSFSGAGECAAGEAGASEAAKASLRCQETEGLSGEWTWGPGGGGYSSGPSLS
ncbi:MAG: thiamine pyrophosphate-dependent enzyme [Candidatus Aminicenantes bacterium]|nr:thiamine pyrophosphate-dependent enzyme [Candidatus Aminicenantes bacterium]